MFHPSLHLLALVCDDFPSGRFEGAILLCIGPSAFLMPSYIHLMLPIAVAIWIISLCSVQYSLAQHLVMHWTLLLAALRVCRFCSVGDCLYSVSAACFASMTGVISDDLASYQSCNFEVFFPKIARAMWWMVSCRVSLFSVAVSPDCDASYSSSKASTNCSKRSG